MANNQMITQIDKFHQVFKEFFEVTKIIIGDLNIAGKTTLTVNDINMMSAFVLNMDKVYILNKFIENSEKYWNKILKKEDDFFMKNSENIFGQYADRPEFNALKIIFGKNKDGVSIVDDETKDDIREYLYSLIKISIIHIFNSREPKVEKKDNKVNISYGKKSQYSNVDIIDHSKKWKIKLW